MAELKTKKTAGSPTKFIASITDPAKRADAKALLAIFKDATGMKPTMWGTSIIGFGMYHYKSERSRQEGDWPLVAFSPRVQSLTVYIIPGFKVYGPLLKKLGRHTTSVGCIYFKRLSDIHVPTLKAIIKKSVTEMRKRYPDAR